MMEENGRFFDQDEEAKICTAIESVLADVTERRAHPFILLLPGPDLRGFQIFTNQPPEILKQVVPLAADMVANQNPARVTLVDEKTGKTTALGGDFFTADGKSRDN